MSDGVTCVELRIVAESERAAQAAIRQLRECAGAARVTFDRPSVGRNGDWLAYGTFEFVELVHLYPRRRMTNDRGT